MILVNSCNYLIYDGTLVKLSIKYSIIHLQKLKFMDSRLKKLEDNIAIIEGDLTLLIGKTKHE